MTQEEARRAIDEGEIYSASTVNGTDFTPHATREEELEHQEWLTSLTPRLF